MPRAQWYSYGQHVRAYSTSLGHTAPEVTDIDCVEASKRETGRIILSDAVPQNSAGAHTRTYSYKSFDWAALKLRENKLVLTMIDLPTP